jgi:hypothetical protein
VHYPVAARFRCDVSDNIDAGAVREGRIVRKVIRFLVVTCCTLAGAQDGLAQTDKRVALVIGNSAYQHTRALPNAKSDAEAIAKLLFDNGFVDVTLKTDLGYQAMRGAVRAFSEAAREAEVALLYYGGHGLEVAGENYLVPTDAKLEREAALEYEAVTLASVLKALAAARRLGVVVLDVGHSPRALWLPKRGDEVQSTQRAEFVSPIPFPACPAWHSSCRQRSKATWARAVSMLKAARAAEPSVSGGCNDRRTRE